MWLKVLSSRPAVLGWSETLFVVTLVLVMRVFVAEQVPAGSLVAELGPVRCFATVLFQLGMRAVQCQLPRPSERLLVAFDVLVQFRVGHEDVLPFRDPLFPSVALLLAAPWRFWLQPRDDRRCRVLFLGMRFQGFGSDVGR